MVLTIAKSRRTYEKISTYHSHSFRIFSDRSGELVAKAYVTDSFRISLRRGPSIENKILKFLPSGLPVEILESKEGWCRVHPLEPGRSSIKGWVLSRYLITRLPWEIQARSLKQENTQLKEKLARIQEEWEETLRRKVGDYLKLKEA